MEELTYKMIKKYAWLWSYIMVKLLFGFVGLNVFGVV